LCDGTGGFSILIHVTDVFPSVIEVIFWFLKGPVIYACDDVILKLETVDFNVLNPGWSLVHFWKF